MEPASILSLISASLTITIRAATIGKDLYTLKKSYQKADKHVQQLSTHISAIRVASRSLSLWLEADAIGSDEVEEVKGELLQVLQSCCDLLSEIQDYVCKATTGAENLSFRGKVSFLWQGNVIQDAVQTLHHQETAILLILKTLSGLVNSPTFWAQFLISNSAQKSRQRAQLQEYENQEVLLKAKRPTSSIFGLKDSNSAIARYSITSTNSDQVNMAFSFDFEVMSSAAYRNCFASLIKKNADRVDKRGSSADSNRVSLIDAMGGKRVVAEAIFEKNQEVSFGDGFFEERLDENMDNESQSMPSGITLGVGTLSNINRQEHETASEPISQSVTSSGPGSPVVLPLLLSLNNSPETNPPLESLLTTTGDIPPPLVGATTVIVHDMLYVFGGRVSDGSRLTSDLYKLDLNLRYWTQIETKGDTPSPRYFHSTCKYGDDKLVCFGGMSKRDGLSITIGGDHEMVEMSDTHIYDITANTWTLVDVQACPKGRYAHCASIVTKEEEPYHYEMVIVGGQDSANKYLLEINVLDLYSLEWTEPSMIDQNMGLYRTLITPLREDLVSHIGTGEAGRRHVDWNSKGSGSALAIFSNYNFLDVKHEFQIRLSDGAMIEMQFPPPYHPTLALRFPSGGIIHNHLIVSGAYLTTKKQNYVFWALNLSTLMWTRVGSPIQGSWNKGIVWESKGMFLMLGDKEKDLVDDYNHRRMNFVDLNIFGL
jgi:hypothetical protein